MTCLPCRAVSRQLRPSPTRTDVKTTRNVAYDEEARHCAVVAFFLTADVVWPGVRVCMCVYVCVRTRTRENPGRSADDSNFCTEIDFLVGREGTTEWCGWGMELGLEGDTDGGWGG